MLVRAGAIFPPKLVARSNGTEAPNRKVTTKRKLRVSRSLHLTMHSSIAVGYFDVDVDVVVIVFARTHWTRRLRNRLGASHI